MSAAQNREGGQPGEQKLDGLVRLSMMRMSVPSPPAETMEPMIA